ncbi:hypothetical protein LBMAG25_16680 [Bacteroidota bacterium]|nr:hypothetical protein LBMAG25_16680 [Bacteroidota bacterium]
MNAYQLLLTDERWQARRSEILARDGQCCKCCGSASNLQVHHRQYHKNEADKQWVNPWEYDGKYLITLCETCHTNGHQHYNIPIFNISKTNKPTKKPNNKLITL